MCDVCRVVHGVGIPSLDEVLRKDLQQVRTCERRLPGGRNEGEDSKCLVRYTADWLMVAG